MNHEIEAHHGVSPKGNVWRGLASADRFELLEYALVFLLSRATLFDTIAPFGLAYFAATFPKQKRLYGLLFACAGILFADYGVASLKYLGSIAIVSTFALLLSEELLSRTWLYGLIAAISIAVNGMIYAFFDGFLLYDIFAIGVEAIVVFLCHLAFSRGSYLLRNLSKRRVFENEEMAMLLLLGAAVIVSISSIPYLSGAAHVLAVLVVMTLSLTHGAGLSAMAGVLVGLLISTTDLFPSQMVGTYAVCALAAGFFRRFGKWGVCLGFFVTNALVMLYFNSGTMMFIEHSYILIAALSLFFLPPTFFSLFGAVGKTPALLPTLDANVRTKQIIDERLAEEAESFSALSDIFREVVGEKVRFDLSDVGTVFEKTTRAVCAGCSMYRYCWQKNGDRMQQMLQSMLPMMQERGYAADIDTDKKFRDDCLRQERFLRVLNQNYELYKVGRMWAGKVRESRSLLADQFEHMSTILKGIRENLYQEVDDAKGLENKIAAALDRKGIAAEHIRVYSGDGYKVSMQMASCGGNLLCAKTVAASISEALGVPMIRTDRCCGEENCKLTFREFERFGAQIGVSYVPKYGEDRSGDSFLSTCLSGGKIALALSDGMGSGEKASKESNLTIRLMERLLTAGFDKETTLRLINSALLNNTTEESFATVDMCLFNPYTAALEFIKIGAAPSYIKSGSKITEVCSTSLPAGIIGGAEPDCELCYAKDGDTVILMTDGVSDAFERVGKTSIQKVLSQITAASAQEMADTLLLEALRFSGGKAGDDMTVLCAQISEMM